MHVPASGHVSLSQHCSPMSPQASQSVPPHLNPSRHAFSEFWSQQGCPASCPHWTQSVPVQMEFSAQLGEPAQHSRPGPPQVPQVPLTHASPALSHSPSQQGSPEAPHGTHLEPPPIAGTHARPVWQLSPGQQNWSCPPHGGGPAAAGAANKAMSKPAPRHVRRIILHP